MAFEKRIFEDGDIEYSVPRWKKIIEELNQYESNHDFIGEINNDNTIDTNDITLKNPVSDSYIRLKKHGDIDIFSENGTGLQLIGDRLIIHADTVEVLSKKFEIHTTANGVTFNNEVMNTGGIKEFPQRKGKTDRLKNLIEGGELDG